LIVCILDDAEPVSNSGRTQPAAISSVNCRTQRIIESLNAMALLGSPRSMSV